MTRPLTAAAALLACCMGPSAAQEADGPLVVCPAFPIAVWQDGRELRIAIDFGGTWVEIARDGDHAAAFGFFIKNCAVAKRVRPAETMVATEAPKP